MSVHRPHDVDLEHSLEHAEAVAGELYEEREKTAKLESQLEAADRYAAHLLARLWLVMEERERALDWATREQDLRLSMLVDPDEDGDDRLLRDIKWVGVLQEEPAS